MHKYSLSIVDHIGFKKYSHTLQLCLIWFIGIQLKVIYLSNIILRKRGQFDCWKGIAVELPIPLTCRRTIKKNDMWLSLLTILMIHRA